MKKYGCWVDHKWVVIRNQTVILEIKSKVVLDLSNYYTKRELEHATGIDTSVVTAKKDFIALELKMKN